MFRRRFLCCGLLVVALTACGGDGGKPKVLESTPSSPSPSPAASPTPSTPHAAAEAAARRYYAELSTAYATGDVTVLRSLHLPSCPCKQLTDGIEQTWRQGSASGGQYTVTGVRVAKANESSASVEVDYDVTPLTIRDAAGKVTTTQPALKGKRTFIDFVATDGDLVIVRILRLGE